MSALQLLRFIIALAAQLGFCAALNLFDDWTLEQMPVRFVAVAICSGIAYLVAVGNFPSSISGRKQAILFWGVAFILRLIALPLTPGDEFWRYQWEGKIQQAGLNPYTHAPDSSELGTLRDNYPYWFKINRRDYRATYPPGAELLFLTLSRITESPLLYKLLFASADLAAAAILLRLIGGTTRYANAAWYAWNPMVVYCFAGAAHFDSLMILPMLAVILCLTKLERAPTARDKWMLALAASVLFGVALSFKLVALLLLPLCLCALGYRAITLVLSLALPALLGLYYDLASLPLLDWVRGTASTSRLNDLFWWTIEETVWPNPRQKNYHYGVIILAVVLIVSLLFCRNWRRGLLWVAGLGLILSPVLHPWYCTWILPLAAWRRTEPWFVLSVTLFSYFLFWNERLFSLPWHSELWLRAIIIIPPLVATLFFLSRIRAEDEAAHLDNVGSE